MDILLSPISDLDRRIDFTEKKVLLNQERLIKQREKAQTVIKRLERQLKAQEDVKKEWIRKINTERERVKVEKSDAMKAHRLNIDDLRVKFENERANKLRDLKVAIQEEEQVISELQAQRDEAAMKTKVAESQITARFQEKLNEMMREEQSAIRSGVIRQKRLLEAPNIYSMAIEKPHALGMKRRATTARRMN